MYSWTVIIRLTEIQFIRDPRILLFTHIFANKRLKSRPFKILSKLIQTVFSPYLPSFDTWQNQNLNHKDLIMVNEYTLTLLYSLWQVILLSLIVKNSQNLAKKIQENRNISSKSRIALKPFLKQCLQWPCKRTCGNMSFSWASPPFIVFLA